MEVYIFDVDKLYPNISPETKEEVAKNYARWIGTALTVGPMTLGTVKRVERNGAEVRVYVQLRKHVERGSTV